MIEPLDVADWHAATDEEAVIWTEGFIKQRDDASLEGPVDVHDAREFLGGGFLGRLPGLSVRGSLCRNLITRRYELAVKAAPARMGRVSVLAGAAELDESDVAFLEPSAQDLAGRERTDEDRGLRTQRLGGFGVAENEVVARDQRSIAGEIAAERARAIGEDRPAGQLGKFAESRGAFVAVFEGMRADHDDAAFGLRQQAGHRGGCEGRADDAAGRDGREGLEVQARGRLEALFGIRGGERVAEGQIEVYRASQRALRALPGVDQELTPVAEEG